MIINLDDHLDQYSRGIIKHALITAGTVKGASALIGMRRSTLSERCKDLGLDDRPITDIPSMELVITSRSGQVIGTLDECLAIGTEIELATMLRRGQMRLIARDRQ